jgi:type II secretory pathway pseudopilin PulG
MKNLKVVIIVIIIILLAGVAVYFLKTNKANNTNTTVNLSQGKTSNEESLLISISPDGTHALYVENNSDGSYRSLKYQNLRTNENNVFDTMSVSSEYHDFTWYGNSKVYYAITGEINNGYTTFYYHDFGSADPTAGTGIVFEDPNLVMQGEVRITGAGEDILYVQKDSKVYSINLKLGASAKPELVKDFGV